MQCGNESRVTYRRRSDLINLSGSYPRQNRRRIATRRRSAIPTVRMYHFCTLIRLLHHIPADCLSLQLHPDVAYRVCMHSSFRRETDQATFI